MRKLKRIVNILKYKMYSLKNKKCSIRARIMSSQISDQAAIQQNVRFQGSSIGRYSYIGRNSLVQRTDIGSFCSVSEGANIGMPTHPTHLVSSSPVFINKSNVLRKSFSQYKFDECPRTTIGHDVWIGAHAQIKSGLVIGTGAIIGAGAVVTHDVPPYAIVAGVPAKIIRYRFDTEKIDKLLKSEWWMLDDDKLQHVASKMDEIEEFLAAL